MRVRLCNPMFGYRYATLVENYGLEWLLELSSGYQFTLYPTDFEVED